MNFQTYSIYSKPTNYIYAYIFFEAIFNKLASHGIPPKKTDMKDYDHRFSGIGRLYGKEGLRRFKRAHICIVGIGGVGSWAAEALARAAVGSLTLVDLDDICVTNTNRQIHALESTLGQPKAEVMAKRIREINPQCKVTPQLVFFTNSSIAQIFKQDFDFVIDAIDNVTNKCLLINTCKRRNIPVITSGGAGGRKDPTKIKIDDLSRTTHDRLLLKVRQRLRKEYGFPTNRKRKFNVPTVFSPEPVSYPTSDGSVCEPGEKRNSGANLRLDCESGYGTTTAVTATFGFAAASCILNHIVDIK